MTSTRFPHSSSASSTSGSVALEQANADLTLLQQSLARSSKISDRMSTVLGELDDRLARLEKSLVPIYRETGKLTRVSKNLESTMRSIDGLLGHHDLVEREEGLVKAGPKQDDLKPYLAAIDRLVSASEALRKTDAKGQSATLAQMDALVESGARQLIGVFTKWVKETSPSMDAGKLYDQGKSFPTLTPSFLENALPLIAYLRALPDPQKTSNVSSNLLSSYTSVRSAYIEESLRNCAKEVLVDATPEMVSLTPKMGSDGDSAKGTRADARGAADRRGFGRVLDVLLALSKSEHALLGTVFASLPASQRTTVYSSLFAPSLTLLTSTGQSLNSLIKKSTHYALAPIAFATFQELSERQVEFDEWVRTKAGRKENEVGDLMHAFRGTCMTSLPGILEETKSWGKKPPVGADAVSAAVSTVTANIVNFMRQLTDSQATAETFLGVLGAGNWGGPSNSSAPASGDENGLLSRYLNDVLSVLLSSLDSHSRLIRGRSGTGAVFLLNNVSFVRHAVLSTAIIDVLGETAEDVLNKRMRTTKASYLEVWSPLVSALLDAGFAEQSGAAGALKAGLGAVTGGGGTERRETKDRFVRFHEALEEVEQLHQQAKFDDGDVELKERLRDEVERMVLPTYTKFVQRHRKDNYSTKYVRLDAEGLEAKIRTIFE